MNKKLLPLIIEMHYKGLLGKINATLYQVLSRPDIKGVVFDMDGTLFNSDIGTIKMMRKQILEMRGFESTVPDKEAIGKGYPEKMTILLGKHDQEMINEAIRRGSVYYAEIAKPIAGVNEALKVIKHKLGLLMAIGTNGFMSMLMPTYDKLSVRLDHYQGTDGDLAKKPSPAIFIKAIEALGLTPEEVAIIEDSGTGSQAALSAKVPEQNVIIYNPYGNGPEGFTTFTTWM